ncbi:MAG: HAMP domain-containing histidine kinase [Clostridium sp.]|nr:HAMP domain-containing histidine kinase [Clostridium sp.]
MGKTKGKRFTEEDIEICENIHKDLTFMWGNHMFATKPRIIPAMETVLGRVETLEKLITGAAHEVRNPIAVIKGHMQMMELDSELPQGIKIRISRLLGQVNQIEKIVKDFASLAKLKLVDMVLDSPLGFLEDVLNVLQFQAANLNIHINRLYPKYIPKVFADPGKLQQVFLNIGKNAVEAMKEQGGKLDVSIRISKDDREVEIEFADTGSGINKEEMEMLFRPFFTTKKHGTGLGLNISKYIMELHGGTIHVKNRKGKRGAVFTIVLPIPVPDANDTFDNIS